MPKNANHTLESTHRLIAQIHSEIRSVLSSKFITDEERKTIYSFYNQILEIDIRLYKAVKRSQTPVDSAEAETETGMNMYNADKYGMK